MEDTLTDFNTSGRHISSGHSQETISPSPLNKTTTDSSSSNNSSIARHHQSQITDNNQTPIYNRQNHHHHHQYQTRNIDDQLQNQSPPSASSSSATPIQATTMKDQTSINNNNKKACNASSESMNVNQKQNTLNEEADKSSKQQHSQLKHSGSSASFIYSITRRYVIVPFRTVVTGLTMLWEFGDQIRQVYDKATPEEQRRADRARSWRMIKVFGCWCVFVAVKDLGLLRRVGMMGGRITGEVVR